jgi:tRNA-modifying protein YgfZ
MDTKAWSWLEVHSAVARIAAGTAELFVPQMVNFELTGGVSFQKGCYPGQEVVARSQYRGTLKRRAYVLHAASPAAVGQEVIHSEDAGQPAGAIALSASFEGRNAALAELKIASLGHGTLHLGAVPGPALQLVPQPYDFPAEQA